MDNNDNNNRTRDTKNTSIGEIFLRIIITAIIVGVAALLTPGFTINGMWSLIIASIVIALLDYFIQKIAGVDASPFGRGITGFIISAIILYATKFIVPGFNISIWGAIIGALVIGILDAIIPGRAM
ncbi:MAG: Phage holin family protein [Sporanaerobacter sp.]|uniref:phage holin family protein n=1 Tax=Sporanaerobacter sp. TaxID=2010183 RepID=UPI003A1007E4